MKISEEPNFFFCDSFLTAARVSILRAGREITGRFVDRMSRRFGWDVDAGADETLLTCEKFLYHTISSLALNKGHPHLL